MFTLCWHVGVLALNRCVGNMLMCWCWFVQPQSTHPHNKTHQHNNINQDTIIPTRQHRNIISRRWCDCNNDKAAAFPKSQSDWDTANLLQLWLNDRAQTIAGAEIPRFVEFPQIYQIKTRIALIRVEYNQINFGPTIAQLFRLCFSPIGGGFQ